jgi:TFIIF-interacting CTD phosphatase-like protein
MSAEQQVPSIESVQSQPQSTQPQPSNSPWEIFSKNGIVGVDPNRNNVILDLDETLLHAISPEETDIIKKNKNKIEKMNSVIMNDNEYLIITRPKLQEFLQYLHAHFNVFVWTAASLSYAVFIVENILRKNDPTRIKLMLFDAHCCGDKEGIKPLSDLSKDYKLPLTLKNTFIIDDNPNVYERQKSNCINVPEFVIENDNFESDNVLERLITMLKPLETTDDVQKLVPDINNELRK